MRIAYVDCTGGVTGELILGALVDLGLAPDQLRRLLAGLTPAAYALDVETVRLPAGPATTVALSITAAATPVALLQAAAGLPPGLAERTVSALRRLFEARSAAAGIAREALDPVQATCEAGLVVGAIGGLAALGVERIYASAVNIGSEHLLPVGEGRGSGAAPAAPPEHPLPVGEGGGEGAATGQRREALEPSAVALALLRGAVVSVGPGPARVTPAAAAIVTEIAASYGSLPPVRLERVGLGAAGQDTGPPLRLILGETVGAAVQAETDWVTTIACNLDDLNPQIYEHVFALLFAAGALDVYVTPIVMKKGRPAGMLTVIGRPEQAEELAGIVLRETTTLGVRFQEMPRRCLRRSFEQVETPYGPITVKIAWSDGAPLRAAPEYETCRRAALEHGVPLQQVIDAAKWAWTSQKNANR